MANALVNVKGLAYDSPITQFPARSGPGTRNGELFKAERGLSGLTVLDIQPDEQNTPNDSDRSRTYQWFKLAFPNGQTAWLREHVLTLVGDFNDWGYGVVNTETYAYLIKRDHTKTGPTIAVTVNSSTSTTASSDADPTPAPAVTATAVISNDAQPAQMIPVTGAASRAWNTYGGLVQQLAQADNIQTATVLAILAIESGGAGFVNGRLKIRFENHIFRKSLLDAGRLADYDANFAGGLRWDDNHQYRENGQLFRTHSGKQDSEWGAFGVAQRLDAELGARSISMGASQVMGFNYRSNGFTSAVEMLAAYSRSESEHVRGLFNFLKNRGLVDAMRRNDFEAVALGYNGSGQVERYGRLMRGAYEAVKPALDAIGVV